MINIDDKTRRLSQATIVVGYKQENKAESIEFEIPDYLKEYGKKICFKTKDSKVFSKLFDNTTSNIFTFTRTETQYGELDATIQFFKTENEDMIIYKTSMLHIIFNESIICEDEVQPDEPKIPILESLIEKVTDLNNTITENEETRNNNENTRILNENERKTNEKERETYYTNIQSKVNNGEFNGATFTPSVDKDGNISWTNNKGLENPTSQNIRGPQGIQGPQGEAFKIKKTYPSIEAMQNDFDNMEVGDYAMIVTSIELEDNAKLYSRTETEWVFITDFSGATGIQGPQGIQGIQGAQGERGIGISKLEVKQGYLYVTLTDNSTQNAGLIITDEVKQWLVTEITNNAESTFNQYYDTKVSEFNENVQAKLDEYNANAEALANKVVELETENTSLKNQIPSGEATGNPIHLTDSSDMECEIVPIGGAEQETVTDNLFNNTWEQGIIASETGAEIDSTENIRSSSVEVNANHLYSISRSIYTSYMSFRFYAKDGAYLGNQLTEGIMTASNTDKRMNANESSMTFTITNANVARMRIVDNSNNLTTKYTLTTEAISPDYPSPVETVGQNVNIFDKDNANTLNAIINGTTKQIAKFDTCRSIYISCDNNEDYTISRKAGTRFVVGTTTNIPVLNATCNQIVQNNTADSITIKTTENDNYLVVFYYNSGTDTLTEEEIRNSIKIEKGLVATPYSPYGQGSVEIEVCNGNILDFNVAQNSKVTVNDDGTLTINGAGGFSLNIDKLQLKAGITYYQKVELISGSISGSNINNTFLSFAGSGAWISNINFSQTILNEDTEKTSIWVNASAIFNNAVIKIWANTDESDFIPHQSYTKVLPIQKEFVKIGDVEDTFVKVDGKWYEKHNIKIIDLSAIASRNFYINNTSTSNKNRWGSAYLTDILNNANVLCTHLKNVTNGDTYNCIEGISIDNKTVYMYIEGVFDYTNLNKFLQKGIKLYYPLATPELIECTVEQEEILNSFYTYKGITNISVDGIATLKVNYKKDLETMFNNIIKQIPSSTSDTTET